MELGDTESTLAVLADVSGAGGDAVTADGPLRFAQAPLRRSEAGHARARTLLRAAPAAQQLATTSALELQLARATWLRSPGEYQYWLAALVQALAAHGVEPRLRSLFDELLGPPAVESSLHADGALTTCQRRPAETDRCLAEFPAIDKRQLLATLLEVASPFAAAQAIAAEYSEVVRPMHAVLSFAARRHSQRLSKTRRGPAMRSGRFRAFIRSDHSHPTSRITCQHRAATAAHCCMRRAASAAWRGPARWSAQGSAAPAAA